MKMICQFLFSVLTLSLMSSNSFAYLAIAESGDLVPEGMYRFGVEPQLFLSDGNGFNFTGFMDSHLGEEVSGRINLGFGDTDFYTGLSVKWVPIPDFQNQPAIGLRGGLTYSRESSKNFFVVKVDPLVSKTFQADYGNWTPYGSIPLMYTSGEGSSTTAFQLVGGTEFTTPDVPNARFGAELGIKAKDSFSYLSIFASFDLNEEKGLKLKR